MYMMNKKYQIFISSTYTDLKEERAKVRDAILRMQHFPMGMESFGADNRDSWSVITRTIDDTDYYVLIIGDNYGSVITCEDGTLISFTQKEYMYAKSQNIPILAFIKESSAPVNPDEITKNHIIELNNFKDIVKKERNVSFWTSANDLAAKVSSSLYRVMNEISRPGWIRNDGFSTTQNIDNHSSADSKYGNDRDITRECSKEGYIDSEYELKEKFFKVCVNHKVEHFLHECDPMAGIALDDYNLFDASTETIERVLYNAPMLRDSTTYKDIQRFIKCTNEYSYYIDVNCQVSNNGKFIKFDNHEHIKNPDSVNNKMMLFRRQLIDIYEVIGKNKVHFIRA